jgi:hypothetical protein
MVIAIDWLELLRESLRVAASGAVAVAASPRCPACPGCPPAGECRCSCSCPSVEPTAKLDCLLFFLVGFVLGAGVFVLLPRRATAVSPGRPAGGDDVETSPSDDDGSDERARVQRALRRRS